MNNYYQTILQLELLREEKNRNAQKYVDDTMKITTSRWVTPACNWNKWPYLSKLQVYY